MADLSKMTLEELWVLFPIILREHDEVYFDWYSDEKDAILLCVGAENVIRINHIGSSAVKGLIAKPTVDILLEIQGNCDVNKLIDKLKESGWILMYHDKEPVAKLAFNKGYTPDGFAEKVFHQHVRYFGDWNELYFRDYLIENPEVAKEYGKLKQELFAKYEHNRDGYTEAKTEFVNRYSAKAKETYRGRYAYK